MTFFFSSRRRHTRLQGDWSSDVCSSDLAIATSILNKPGRLTDQEFDEMREHPARGLELLKAGGVDDPVVLDVCLHHHERSEERRVGKECRSRWSPYH